ncbi:MAG: YaiI/YqxD family protein [Caulobacterales bacterium]|nr:YaiI/YqxD family protein [Caulobacterales bacterium]
MTTLYIDADACPVKEEIYKVADRYQLPVFVVANTWMRTPGGPRIQLIVVEEGPDVADDWIAERAGPGDIVVTQDIPLADRVVKAGGEALAPTGRVFDAATIGAALATRDLLTDLRSAGLETRGPAAFSGADRSRFLQALDAAVHRVRKSAR